MLVSCLKNYLHNVSPGREIIQIMCHPDRSAAEWRDLLFVSVSNHATNRDYVVYLEAVP
jgi:hypothetical protein